MCCISGEEDVTGDLYNHHPVVRASLNGALRGFPNLFCMVSLGDREVCTGRFSCLFLVHCLASCVCALFLWRICFLTSLETHVVDVS